MVAGRPMNAALIRASCRAQAGYGGAAANRPPTAIPSATASRRHRPLSGRSRITRHGTPHLMVAHPYSPCVRVIGPPDVVLLIDVENIVGQKAKPNLMAARVGVLIRLAGPGARVVAACAKDRITVPSTHVLHAHNVTLLTVGATKDAADEALLAEAQRLAHQGCRRFVVASNDSRFAQLADLGTLEIVVWKTQRTRPVYAARASRIHRLQCPPATTPGIIGPASTAAPQPEPSSPPAASVPAKPTPVGQSTRYVHRGASWASLCAGTPVRLAVTGLGLLAAGVIFGVGAAIGDRATHHAIRRRGVLRWRAGAAPVTTAHERSA